MNTWLRALTLYLVAAVIIGAAWWLLAPRGSCYVRDDVCRYFGGNESSVFFFQDATFAAIALVIAVPVSLAQVHFLAVGIRRQLVGAVLAVAAGWVAAQVAMHFAVPVVDPIDNRFSHGWLQLRSYGPLFVWPALQQVLVVLRGPNLPN